MNRPRRKELLNLCADTGFTWMVRYLGTSNVDVSERRGAILGVFAYLIDRKHRERAKSNLMLAYPDWSEKKRSAMAKEVFRHFGRVAADFCRTPRRTEAELLQSGEGEGLHFLEEACAKNRGVLAISGHVGNWERLAHWAIVTGRELTTVARGANQSGVNQRMQELRCQAGMKVLARGNAARGILQVLRENGMVALLADQNAAECFVPFFGIPTGTTLGPAVLSMRTKAPILPIFCVRIGPGRYRVEAFKALNLEGDVESASAIMADFNASLERVVRDYPEQWLWMHDRWKESRERGLL